MDPSENNGAKKEMRSRFVSAPDFSERNPPNIPCSLYPPHTPNEANVRKLEAVLSPGNVTMNEQYSQFNSTSTINITSQANNSSSVFPSTTFLHIQERPSVLPRKSFSEAERHRKECDQIISQVKRKQHGEYLQRVAEKEKKNRSEIRTQHLLSFWRCIVVQNWKFAYRSKRVYDAWWHGLPSAIRSQVWSLVICNPLGITRELFDACLCRSQRNIKRITQEQNVFDRCYLEHEVTNIRLPVSANTPFQSNDRNTAFFRASRRNNGIGDKSHSVDNSYLGCSPNSDEFLKSNFLQFPALCSNIQEFGDSSLRVISLDVSRTFPMLGLFQENAPYHQNLHDVLSAYVSYQPSVGYLQGMSFIAAILLLVMDDVFLAFLAFATILNRKSFHAFYVLDESEFTAYFSAFDHLLEECMPRLSEHFFKYNLDSRLFLFDWIFTIFSRSLPLEVNLRIWDLYIRDGETALLLSALGIMRLYEEKLLACDFDQLASFLTGPMPQDMCPDSLVLAMRSLGLRNKTIKEAIGSARKREDNAPILNSNLLVEQNSDTVMNNSVSSSSLIRQHHSSNSETSSTSSSNTASLRRRCSISFPYSNLDPIEEPSCSQNSGETPIEGDITSVLNGFSNPVTDPRKNTKNSSESDLCSRAKNSNISDHSKPFAILGKSKGQLFTRVTLLRRHDSMEDWSAQVKTDFPKRESIVDFNSSNFMFTD